MSINRVLNDEEVKQARRLRKEGKTKRQIAEIMHVSSTTIWNVVFNNKNYKKKYKDNSPRCKTCEIITTNKAYNDGGIRYIPMNFYVREYCLCCYLKRHGVEYRDIIIYLTIK